MTKRLLRRILLVDDDPDIQEVTTVVLSHLGNFDVRACGSAVEALHVAQQFDPDIILLDYQMPGLDGKGAIEALREMSVTAETPVIFMTARVQPREIMAYRELGSLGVIPKPFDPDTLAQTIQGMWDRQQEARLREVRREELATLRRVYAAELPGRLRVIEGAAAVLQGKGWDSQAATSLYDMAHRLAGSAAIYGFPGVSEAAVRIGSFANEHSPGRWRATDSRSLLKLVGDLSAALHECVADDAPQATPERHQASSH
jgi:two-component system, OmpR family, response regulator